jgi:O-antigen/teichoic acid export membrane protein/anti-sigma regulatory factor (Ser/Thr protein kinase)
MMFSSGMAIFIRMDGNPKASAAIVMIANAVNLVLDYVLIRFLDTGIAGAGLSTTLGYVAGSAIVIPYLANKKRSFHFVRPGKTILKTLRDILKSGMSKAVSQVCNLVRSLVINAVIVTSLGSIGMSIMTVCTNVLMIANIFEGGVADTLLPIVGTLYGEKDFFGIRQTMRTARRVLIVCSAVLVALLLIAPQLIGIVFGLTSPDTLALLKPALRLYALYIPFSAALLLLQNFYNTTERRSLATSLVVMDGLLFVVPFAVLLSRIQSNLLWLSYAASGACTLFVLLFLARRIRKKEDVQGLLLIRERDDYIHKFDFTIEATREEAVRLSERVMALEEKAAVNTRLLKKVALVLEEMTVASVHYAHADSTGLIDILIYVTDAQVTILMRDNGMPFNPLEYIPEENDGCITDSIGLVKKLASRMEYSRQLGFNTSVLTFEIQ